MHFKGILVAPLLQDRSGNNFINTTKKPFYNILTLAL
jgi:hypothetical protein